MSIDKQFRHEVIEELYSLPLDYIKKVLSNYDREFAKLILRFAPDNFLEQVRLMELKPLIKITLMQIEQNASEKEDIFAVKEL